MEQILIEQFLNSGVSLKKIKAIIENTEQVRKDNLDGTVSANTSGLRLMTCSGCHKTLYEDKFLLNKMNKRYRSCINCVSRARMSRRSSNIQKHILQTKDNSNLLAILDKQEDHEAYAIEPHTHLIDYPHIEPTQEPDFPIEPNTDISNYSHIEPITKQKHNSKQTNKNAIPLQFPEPDNLGAGLFNLFNSK